MITLVGSIGIRTMTDTKTERLRRSGTLNPRPDAVTDALFRDSAFFDPRDLLQVRYEMVRCTERGVPLKEAAARFGTSVPTCVRANRAFRERGLQGLIPQRRGPRAAHKITPQILAFVEHLRAEHGPLGSRRLVPLIEARFGVRIRPRSLDKALAKETAER